jgi:ribokinase
VAASIIVFGSLNMDLMVRVERSPRAGETLRGLGFLLNPGGKGANQAVACARQGASVSMVGCVGKDSFGDTLRNALASDDIDVTNVRGVEASTGVAVVTVDAKGENSITLIPGANEFVTADPEMLSGKFLLLQCEVPMTEVLRAAKLMRAKGATVVLNPAPVCPLPDELWSLVDIIVMNEIEASELAGICVDNLESAALAAAAIRKRGPSTAIVTLGSQGVLMADGARSHHFPARQVQVVDTTAAGDTFIGAMCAARAAGASMDAAVIRGIDAAALCVTRPGAQASIPYLHELSVA